MRVRTDVAEPTKTEPARPGNALPSLSDFRKGCTLTILAGPVPGALIIIDENGGVLGRGAESSIRIEDAGISRRHAKLSRRDDLVFVVEDLDSKNGTLLNGKKISAPQVLETGDRVQLGRNVVLLFNVHNLEEQRALTRLYESAVRDPLTMLYNRRYLEERLQGEFAYSLRHGTQLSMLLIDLDHFRRINENYGNPAGDVVLRAVADALDRIVRCEDVLARYGGEEFCIMVRGTESDSASVLAERIRMTIADLSIPFGNTAIRVEASIGVATVTPGKEFAGTDAFLSTVEGALYRAKNEGRNCVWIA